MRVGDTLEVLAVIAFAAAGYVGFTPVGRALIVGGVGVFYLGQCFSATPWPTAQLSFRARIKRWAAARRSRDA